jgi:hypothetical protein
MTIQLLTDGNVKIITFPSHTSGIFQILDLVFFEVFRQTKRRLCKDASVHYMEEHARRVFRAFETAAASSNVGSNCEHTEFTDAKCFFEENKRTRIF